MKIKPSIKPKLKFNYDISVVIVCRNGRNITKNCLAGISALKVKEIIVVDNNSDDGTAEVLLNFKKKDRRFKIIHNNKNNGFAEANNQGFNASSGKFILFLNNDTLIQSDFFPPILATLSSDKKIAAVQPMILFPDGTIDSIGSYLTPTGFLYHRAHRLKPNKKFLKTEAVYTLKGACMLWKREVLEKIGTLKESYFAYFEETELCHRAINSGYKVLVNPNSSITHLGGFTSNSMDQEFIQFHNAKNRITTYILHLPLNVLCTLFIFHLFLSELIVFKTILSGQVRLGVRIQYGLYKGLLIGLVERVHLWRLHRNSLDEVTKNPDVKYYISLFTSLKGYTRVW